MLKGQSPPEPPADDYRINFFRPRAGFMRKEVVLICIMLAGWLLMTFGYQVYLAVFSPEIPPADPLSGPSIFGFPWHFWFNGQFLILWFIFLCFIFNSLIDRLTERYRDKRH